MAVQKHTPHSLWELRRQRSVTHTNLAKWEAKSAEKIKGYNDKLAQLEIDIQKLEAEEAN